MIKRILLTAILACALAPAAWAQDRVGLSEAVAEAVRQNPEVAAALREIDAAKAREVQAAAWPNPNVQLQAEEVPLTSAGGGVYMIGVSQPLLLAGQRQARVEAARLDREFAESQLAILQRDLAAQVRDAYAQVLYEEAEVRQERLNFETAKALREATQARYKAGEVPRIEVLRAEVEESRARRALEMEQARERQAQGRLNVLLGREAQAPLSAEELPMPRPGALPPVGDMIEESLKSRAELRQAEVMIMREMMQRRLAQSSLWTGTAASLSAGTAGGAPAISGSFSFPLPIYRQQGEIAEAEANRLRAEARRAALRNQITLEVEQAYREAEIAAQQVEVFRESYLPQAERLAENARKRFQVGEGGGLEVLEANRARGEARAEYHMALLAYRQAHARLQRAVGASSKRLSTQGENP